MKKQSAGIVLYRLSKQGPQVLLVHPGGPFWAKKDLGAWSIPKGEFEEDEAPLSAAIREFHEETGFMLPSGEPLPLGTAKLSSGKVVYAWALSGDATASNMKSNTFSMEWPPKSGVTQEFPEVDKAAWYTLEEAKAKLNKGQVPFIEALAEHLGASLAAQTSLF
jgi:predicted NUDIX family NTP pyrophosphohydrolase